MIYVLLRGQFGAALRAENLVDLAGVVRPVEEVQALTCRPADASRAAIEVLSSESSSVSRTPGPAPVHNRRAAGLTLSKLEIWRSNGRKCNLRYTEQASRQSTSRLTWASGKKVRESEWRKDARNPNALGRAKVGRDVVLLLGDVPYHVRNS